MPDGSRRQRQYHDFFNYAGLHRPVWLYSTPVAHIDDITVVTDIEDGIGVVRYSADIEERGSGSVRALLRDADGKVVAEATVQVDLERVDVLVTDLRMPEIDGLSLLRASVELDPSRPVILMTAYGTFDTAMRATEGGAFHYIMKPFRLDALVRVLDQAQRRR